MHIAAQKDMYTSSERALALDAVSVLIVNCGDRDTYNIRQY